MVRPLLYGHPVCSPLPGLWPEGGPCMTNRFPSARSVLLLVGVAFAVVGCATSGSTTSVSHRDDVFPAASPGPASSFPSHPSSPVQAP